MASKENIFDQELDFWKEYVEARPQVPDSYFESILDYHVKHGGQFDTLHDAGAGIGVHTARLAKKFDHVIVSDPSQSNIDNAKTYLKNEQKCSFQVAKLEDKTAVPPSSVDMVFVANAIHWTDVEAAMEAVAHQLRPGGAFACAGFWNIVLLDENLQDKWQKIYGRLADVFVERSAVGESAYVITEGNYDAVPLDKKYFQSGARRVMINHSPKWSWWNGATIDVDVEAGSRVGDTDVKSYESADGWRFETDIHGLRKQLDTLFFGDTPDERLSELWRALETAVGDKKVSGLWPAMLILATRNNVPYPA